MERRFSIDNLSNQYGTVGGEETDGKYYLLLDDYIGYSEVEISKEAFDALYDLFCDN